MNIREEIMYIRVKEVIMYCPSCRAEYIEGVKKCPDCGALLVDELALLDIAESRPKLRILTLLVMGVTVYMFILRTIGTILPGLFANLALARIATVLSFISSLALLLFFVFFRREYAIDGRAGLKRAAAYGLTGAFVAVIVDLKGVFIVFSSTLVSGNAGWRYFDAIWPAVASILIMLFFILFYRRTGKPALKRISLLAMLASIIAAMTSVFTLFNYVLSGQFRWLSEFAVENMLVFLPIYAFVSVAFFMFYLAFYRELE
jgi:hypothetical protein